METCLGALLLLLLGVALMGWMLTAIVKALSAKEESPRKRSSAERVDSRTTETFTIPLGDGTSVKVQAEIKAISYGQVFRTTIRGVTRTNDDGMPRQDLIRKCRPGEKLELRRDRNNAFDQYAIAVYNSGGKQLGYLPAGDSRLADHMDTGGSAEATVYKVTGGGGRTFGCVVEIVKHDPDWKATEPFRQRNKEIEELLALARETEETNRERAVDLYRSATQAIKDFDGQGFPAAGWRYVRYPINRLSLVLEKQKRYQEALGEIQTYERTPDRRGLTASESETIAARKSRLLKRLAGAASQKVEAE
jgi:hypothetical protein